MLNKLYWNLKLNLLHEEKERGGEGGEGDEGEWSRL